MSQKNRTSIRLSYLPERYPALRRLVEDPHYTRATFLAAAEVGAMYLYAHDHERRELLDLLSSRMQADFEDQFDHFNSDHGGTPSSQCIAPTGTQERGQVSAAISNVPIFRGSQIFASESGRGAAQPNFGGDLPDGNQSTRSNGSISVPALSSTAKAMMASFGESFTSGADDK